MPFPCATPYHPAALYYLPPLPTWLEQPILSPSLKLTFTVPCKAGLDGPFSDISLPCAVPRGKQDAGMREQRETRVPEGSQREAQYIPTIAAVTNIPSVLASVRSAQDSRDLRPCTCTATRIPSHRPILLLQPKRCAHSDAACWKIINIRHSTLYPSPLAPVSRRVLGSRQTSPFFLSLQTTLSYSRRSSIWLESARLALPEPSSVFASISSLRYGFLRHKVYMLPNLIYQTPELSPSPQISILESMTELEPLTQALALTMHYP